MLRLKYYRELKSSLFMGSTCKQLIWAKILDNLRDHSKIFCFPTKKQGLSQRMISGNILNQKMLSLCGNCWEQKITGRGKACICLFRKHCPEYSVHPH